MLGNLFAQPLSTSFLVYLLVWSPQSCLSLSHLGSHVYIGTQVQKQLSRGKATMQPTKDTPREPRFYTGRTRGNCTSQISALSTSHAWL